MKMKSLLVGTLIGAGITIAALLVAGVFEYPTTSGEIKEQALESANLSGPSDAELQTSSNGTPSFASTEAVPVMESRGRSYDINGESYSLSTNADGAVLTSPQGKRIFMGKDCDVLSDEFGRGRWDWANGGFAIRFDLRDFKFPRMDAPVDIESCRS